MPTLSGSFTFEGAKWVLEKIMAGKTFYLGLHKLDITQDPEGQGLDDESTMEDVLEEYDHINEGGGVGRRAIELAAEAEAAPEPEDGYEGIKPAIIDNIAPVYFGPWTEGLITGEEPEPEIIAVFLADNEVMGEGRLIAYQNFMLGRQPDDGQTLRFSEEGVEIEAQ